jgi:multiple sugar transport system permease protein
MTTLTTVVGEKRPEILERGIVLFRYIVLTAVGLMVFMPFILAFLGSFKNNTEVIAFPPTLLPETWLLGNWKDLFTTDLGGSVRPEGVTSVGLIVGMFAFYLTFLATGLQSNIQADKSFVQKFGLGISAIIIVLAGFGIRFYLLSALPRVTAVAVSVPIAMAVLLFIALGIIAMSSPDWKRAIISLLGSLLVMVVVTLLFTQLATWAGAGRFARWFFNTALLSIVRSFLQIFFCSMAAYALARLFFPGKKLILGYIVLSMAVPGAVTLIPSYVIISRLGWLNAWYSLVFPGLIVPGTIFMLTQYLKSIPRELEEAALIDGASYFQIYRDLILPLARPALLTVFILNFQAMWNDYLTPLLYFQTNDMWVLNVALQVFQGQYSSDWNLVLVGAMVNAIPVLALFAFFSRYYIEGVSYAGIKG